TRSATGRLQLAPTRPARWPRPVRRTPRQVPVRVPSARLRAPEALARRIWVAPVPRRAAGATAMPLRTATRRETGTPGRARRSDGVPELPEVEVVRSGLDRHVVGRTIRSV